VIFSDANNHASMIEGIRRSGAQRRVFAHNDPQALDAALSAVPKSRPRLVAFESLYSMDGDIAPMAELLRVVREHGALSFVDETHAVGVHGPRGGGLLQAQGLLDQVDFVQGGLGKGYGVLGGFITASAEAIDFVRSHAPGFIFTTALPPAVAAGARASVRHLANSQVERGALFARVASLRAALQDAAMPVMNGASQILPLLIGNAARCSEAADRLLLEHGVYLQAINYPTVPRGGERLRLTPSPLHDAAMQQHLLAALRNVLGARNHDTRAA
jgi:5-aminolevulinate synthase